MGKTNYEIAHAFAYGATEGHTGNYNLYISGDCIYSYGSHFCIARRVNENTILMTTRTYSNTTARHISYVRNACRHFSFVYCHNPMASHASNLDEYLCEIKTWLGKLARARKPENYLQEIRIVINHAKKYCDLFGIEMGEELREHVEMMIIPTIALTTTRTYLNLKPPRLMMRCTQGVSKIV